MFEPKENHEKVIDHTKSKNKLFFEQNIGSYFSKYSIALSEVLAKVDTSTIEKAYKIINETVKNNATILIAGNGGSAAMANHLCCDWVKGTFDPKHVSVKAHSLSANISLMSALINDLGNKYVFSSQIEMLGRRGDTALLISSSGDSENILEAAKKAREFGMKIISFTGFSGGKVAPLSDVVIHVPSDNYGLVEDAHQILIHVFSQYIYTCRQKA